MVFVRFLYGSSTTSRWCMVVPLQTTRINDGGSLDAHDVTTVSYSACTVKLVTSQASTIAYRLMVIMIKIFCRESI